MLTAANSQLSTPNPQCCLGFGSWVLEVGRLLVAEVYLGRLLGVLRRLEVRILPEPEDLGGHVRGEAAPGRVVLLDPLVVTLSGDGDAIFGARQFVHEPLEVRVRLQL